jgi:hypothetical protein
MNEEGICVYFQIITMRESQYRRFGLSSSTDIQCNLNLECMRVTAGQLTQVLDVQYRSWEVMYKRQTYIHTIQ